MTPDPHNIIFQQAVAFVNQTGRHLFLTGKAGTGKTTFLKFIKENTFKKLAVLAPTGVAAINAGGVTLHSFFQLPLGPFVPVHQMYQEGYEGEMNNPATLIRNLKLSGNKKELIRELDLLIIDEVSMVRADLLDAVDTVLRHVRRQPLVPFGGVQMVYIGDLFQLPPVVKNEEWNMLKSCYATPFFFSAAAVRHCNPLYIELKKIYRQKDESFIHILNNVRNNCCTANDLEFLHQYYKPGFVPDAAERYITLTSHNSKADAINQGALENLPAQSFTYAATITGDFPDRIFPAEAKLYLKEGAQIMFIKNDKGEYRRYYNGKIATIARLEKERIVVNFANEPGELELERETWTNIRYQYVREKDQVDEEELGTFTQYPIRLAWAITIHKSQGLTFEKAVIDAGASFAPGQVYVSLSRLTSLQGLVLHSQILPNAISTDQRIIDFVKSEVGEEQLRQMLEQEQKIFIRYSLVRGFAWDKLVEVMGTHNDGYEHRKIPEKDACTAWGKQLAEEILAYHNIALKFTNELQRLFTSCEADGYKQLYTRIQAATTYFIKAIDEVLLTSVTTHIAEVKKGAKVKRYIKDLYHLQLAVAQKKKQLEHALHLAEALQNSVDITALLNLVHENQKPAGISHKVESKNTPDKPERGASHKLTLQLFRQGNCISKIAAERNLAVSTIEGHLASFVATGEVDVLELVEAPKLYRIMAVIAELQQSGNKKEKIITHGTKPVLQGNAETNTAAMPGHTLIDPLLTALSTLPTYEPPAYSAIKEQLDPDYTFTVIRAALNCIEIERSRSLSSVG